MSRILDKSLKLAYDLLPDARATNNRNFHFCFVFRRNRLIAIGLNDMRNHDIFTMRMMNKFKVYLKKDFPFKHAEISAINRLWGRDWVDSSLKFVVIRLNSFGNLQDSKPCPRCSEIMKALGIATAYWSTKGGVIVKGDL